MQCLRWFFLLFLVQISAFSTTQPVFAQQSQPVTVPKPSAKVTAGDSEITWPAPVVPQTETAGTQKEETLEPPKWSPRQPLVRQVGPTMVWRTGSRGVYLPLAAANGGPRKEEKPVQEQRIKLTVPRDPFDLSVGTTDPAPIYKSSLSTITHCNEGFSWGNSFELDDRMQSAFILNGSIYDDKLLLDQFLSGIKKNKSYPSPRYDGTNGNKFKQSELIKQESELELLAIPSQNTHLLSRLCREISDRADSEFEKQKYLAKSYIFARDWQNAWTSNERSYKIDKEEVSSCLNMARVYEDMNRPIEACIWLSRYLRIAPTWREFQDVYEERARIERDCYSGYLKDEPKIFDRWPIEKLPIKIFVSANEAIVPLDRCKEITERTLRYWMIASEGKLEYKFVEKREAADLVCLFGVERPDEVRYSHYEGSLTVPTKLPQPPELAETFLNTTGGGNGTLPLIQNGRIEFYLSQTVPLEQRGYEDLECIALHEFGHALGISHHHDEDCGSGCVMSAMYTAPNLVPFSNCEIDDIRNNYSAYPVRQSAVAKYHGLTATALNESPHSRVDRVQLQQFYLNFQKTLARTKSPLEIQPFLTNRRFELQFNAISFPMDFELDYTPKSLKDYKSLIVLNPRIKTIRVNDEQNDPWVELEVTGVHPENNTETITVSVEMVRERERWVIADQSISERVYDPNKRSSPRQLATKPSVSKTRSKGLSSAR